MAKPMKFSVYHSGRPDRRRLFCLSLKKLYLNIDGTVPKGYLAKASGIICLNPHDLPCVDIRQIRRTLLAVLNIVTMDGYTLPATVMTIPEPLPVTQKIPCPTLNFNLHLRLYLLSSSKCK